MTDESAIRVYKRTLLCIMIITINTKKLQIQAIPIGD